MLTLTAAGPTATVALSASNSTPIVGQALTFMASVFPSALGAPSPTGTVQFQVDGSNFGATVAMVNGAATSGTVVLTAGSHSITAVYSGDSTYAGSPRSLTLTAVIPSATVNVSASSPVTFAGQPQTFTATVTPSGPGEPTPTGTVQFELDGSAFGTAVALAGGAATSGSVTLTAGSHKITAVYSGDSTYAGVSGSLTLTAVPPASFAVGNLDPTFGYQGTVQLGGAPEDIVTYPDGRILVSQDYFISRYTADGRLDPTFGSLGTAAVLGGASVALQPDGKIVASARR